MVFFDPVVGADFFAPELCPLVIAPEITADALIHLNRAHGSPPLKTVGGLVGIKLLAKAVRPFEQTGRVVNFNTLRPLGDNGFQILGAHDPAPATAGMNPPAVRDHAGNTDLIFTGLTDGQGVGFRGIVAQLFSEHLMRFRTVFPPQVGRIADGDFSIANMDIHRPGRFAGHHNIVIAAETNHVRKLASTG